MDGDRPPDDGTSGRPIAASSLGARVAPRFHDEEHGTAMFATAEVAAGAAAGSVLLEERPVAFAPSLMSTAVAGVSVCPGCGRFRAGEAAEEIGRLLRLRAELAVAGKSPDAPCADDPPVVAAARVALTAAMTEGLAARVSAAKWLGEAIDIIARHLGESATGPWFGGPPCGCDGWAGPTAGPVPTATDSPRVAAVAEALRGLAPVAERFDERARLMAAIALAARHGDPPLRGAAEEQRLGPPRSALEAADWVRAAAAGFDEGRWLVLSGPQREVLAAERRGLNRLLRAAFDPLPAAGAAEGGSATGGEEDGGLLTQQDVFLLRCVLDANTHTCIVVNPLWALARAPQAAALVADLASPGPPPPRRAPLLAALAAVAPLGADVPAAALEALTVLELLCRGLPGDAQHCVGTALFALGSKFNHSCRPAAKFVPTVAPARGLVVATADVAAGAEVRISYIDAMAFGSATERREYLALGYGFTCDCPACAMDPDADNTAAAGADAADTAKDRRLVDADCYRHVT